MCYTPHVFFSGKDYNMLIDKGSCENIVSIEVANKLNLPTTNPHIYKLTCFKKRNEVKVTNRYLVSFCIRKRYMDEVWFDIRPIDACYILLIRP
jgi:Flp pilus assembly CpaF family ATPase